MRCNNSALASGTVIALLAGVGSLLSRIACALVVAACACSDEPSAGPDAAADLGQGSETSAVLVINEVAPKPASGADWLELMNTGDEAIDLCGYFVTDSLDRLDHYYALGGSAPPDPCEPRWLEPGGYLVIDADDDTGAPFKLGIADEAHVVTTTGATVDSFLYVYPSGFDGESLARTPNGSGRFYPVAPTPNDANPEQTP